MHLMEAQKEEECSTTLLMTAILNSIQWWDFGTDNDAG